MITKLNDFGIYYEVKNFDNSPHSFWFFSPWFEETVEASVNFLDKIFKN
jgi:pectinesterase